MRRSLAYYAFELLSLAAAVLMMAALVMVWRDLRPGAPDALGYSILLGEPIMTGPATPAISTTVAIRNILALAAGSALLVFIGLSALSRFAGRILRQPRDRYGRLNATVEAFRAYISFVKLCFISLFLFLYMPYLSMSLGRAVNWYHPVYAYTVWPAALLTGTVVYIIILMVIHSRRKKAKMAKAA